MSPLARAALLGVAGGMRSFVPPAALALRGRLGTRLFPAAAAAEMVADKLPAMGSRLEFPGIGGRLGGSGGSGLVLAGPAGAVVCAGVAMLSAQACFRGRALLAAQLGSDLPGAFAEDALAIAIAAYATR